MATQRIVVVGGGIGGLAVAFRLRRRLPDASITILEASPRWGGLLWSSRETAGRATDAGAWAEVSGELLLEHGADAFLRTKPAGMRLVEDLGLSDELVSTRPEARRSLIARGWDLHPVPDGFYLLAPGRWLPFLASPLVSWPGKLRMMIDLVLPRRAADAPDESLAALVRRRLGREALARLAQPLVGGIHTADPELLSVAAAMPQIAEMERAHRSLSLAARARAREAPASGARYGLFASLRGGLGRLIERLVEQLSLPEAGIDAGRACELRLGTSVTAIERWAPGAGSGFRIMTDQGTIQADIVVVAGPAHVAAALCRPVDASLADELGAIRYHDVATINLAWPRAAIARLPEAAGFVVPAVEGRELIAASFVDRKFAGRVPDGIALIRAFVGGALRPGALAHDDQALVRIAVEELGRWLGIASPPLFARVSRMPRSMPQYDLGHLARVAAIRARERAVPGLALIGNGYDGVGIPDICAQAEAAAVRLAAAAPTPGAS